MANTLVNATHKNQEVAIRPARICDIPDMLILLEQLFSIESDFTFDSSKQTRGLRQLIDSSTAYVLVAESNGIVIGMCSIQVLISTAVGARSGILEDFVIDARWRDHGVGTMLLSSILDLAHDLELSRLRLLADKDNLPALHFYSQNEWDNTNLICLTQSLTT